MVRNDFGFSNTNLISIESIFFKVCDQSLSISCAFISSNILEESSFEFFILSLMLFFDLLALRSFHKMVLPFCLINQIHFEFLNQSFCILHTCLWRGKFSFYPAPEKQRPYHNRFLHSEQLVGSKILPVKTNLPSVISAESRISLVPTSKTKLLFLYPDQQFPLEG